MLAKEIAVLNTVDLHVFICAFSEIVVPDVTAESRNVNLLCQY